jgi:hypothetical protein
LRRCDERNQYCVELGILWDRQDSTLEVRGTQRIQIADLVVSNHPGHLGDDFVGRALTAPGARSTI